MRRNKPCTQEEIIAAFKTAHGDLYDYSRVIYVKGDVKVTIGCPVHGWFEQIPISHKGGCGCSKCNWAKRNRSRKITLEEFIKRSKKHHGDKYDYSLVDLVNNGMPDKLKIICPIHGAFMQEGQAHSRGCGCKKCEHEIHSKRHRLTQEQFLAKAKSFHGNTYDYSEAKYVKTDDHITIICRIHGRFKQRATLHANSGYGCQKCNQSKGERTIGAWLQEHGISYSLEKKFEDCLSPFGNHLKFDFYIPEKNMLIEYDGHQHYRHVSLFGGAEAFETLKRYDKMKNQYAKKKGIPLLRIPFFSLKKVPNLLSKFFGET